MYAGGGWPRYKKQYARFGRASSMNLLSWLIVRIVVSYTEDDGVHQMSLAHRQEKEIGCYEDWLKAWEIYHVVYLKHPSNRTKHRWWPTSNKSGPFLSRVTTGCHTTILFIIKDWCLGSRFLYGGVWGKIHLIILSLRGRSIAHFENLTKQDMIDSSRMPSRGSGRGTPPPLANWIS